MQALKISFQKTLLAKAITGEAGVPLSIRFLFRFFFFESAHMAFYGFVSRRLMRSEKHGAAMLQVTARPPCTMFLQRPLHQEKLELQYSYQFPLKFGPLRRRPFMASEKTLQLQSCGSCEKKKRLWLQLRKASHRIGQELEVTKLVAQPVHRRSFSTSSSVPTPSVEEPEYVLINVVL